MLSLYQLGQPFLLLLLRLLAKVSSKFSELVGAREGVLERWRAAAPRFGQNRIWIHVSSVGELEQARPVMEYLGARHSLVLSYFSTSVPKLVSDWSFASYADYLPFDTPEAMREMMALVKPRALVLNRYDLWPNHVLAAKEAGVPVILINASTPPLGWFGGISLFARSRLFTSVDGWTFVDAAAAAAWEPYIDEPAKGLVAGDPRVDRALARAERLIAEGRARQRLALWKRKSFCLVAGSTWTPDEKLLLQAWAAVDGEKSLVIVPHEPDELHLVRLEKELANRGFSSVRFSRLGTSGRDSAEVLIVDQRGFLAEIYGLGDLAYVGGGFTRHIHSIIEPVAHGRLVAFGPRYARSPEAFTLWAAGAACALSGPRKAMRLAAWIRQMREDSEERKRALDSLRVFLQVHRGAGERVGQFVEGRLGS
ncbi:MAG TPA: glycosyltransferase N-terminal domain-containing protein [Bdellovibrionota bacterium]|jgi:3-deoxy-D-manno-octulosonic-acid transferase